MKVGELCVREVVVAWRDESVVEAARRMREAHVGALVVVEGAGGAAVPKALLTDRDIVVSAVAEAPERLTSLYVGDVALDDVLTARDDELVHDVVRRMRARGVRRVPVVDDEGILVGILALDDVIEVISEELSDLVRIIARGQAVERVRRP